MKNQSVFQINTIKIICLSLFLTATAIQISGQVSSVEKTLSGIRENVDRVNQLAESQDMYKAVELLSNTRRDFDAYLSHYLDDEYRAARKENPAYTAELKLQFSNKLTAAYWEDRVKRSQNAVKNAKEAFAARNYQRTLNAQDEVWAYLKTAYTVAVTIKDVAQNLITQNYVEAAKSAYDGANDFIGNYQEIEEARLQIINTNRYEIEVQTLIKRAERMEEANWQLASYMRAWEQDVDDLNRLTDRFNMRVNTLNNEAPAAQSDSDDQSVVSSSQIADSQKTTPPNVSANQGTLPSSNQNAHIPGARASNTFFHSYWSNNKGQKVKFRQNGQNVEIEGTGTGQIQNGVLVYSFTEKDGTQRKNEYRLLDDGYKMEVKTAWSDKMINDHLTVRNNFTAPSQQQIADFRKTNGNFITSVWSYSGSAMAMFGDKDGDQVPDDFDNCPGTPKGLTVSNGGVDITGCPVKGSTPQTPLAQTSGADSPASQKSVNSPVIQNNGTTSTGSKTDQKDNGAPKTSTPANLNAAGQNSQASSSGNATPVNSSSKPERIGYAVNKNSAGASQMCRVPVYRLTENEQLVFKHLSGTFQKFYVRWAGVSFEEVLFEKTTDVVYSTAELMARRPEKAMFLDFWLNQYSDVSCTMEAWVLPSGVIIPADWKIPASANGGAAKTSAGNFYELIKQADEAFNRKYWNETGGVQTSSNPKQESFDLLRKCDPLVANETNIQQKYSMVKTLSAKYAEYAKRVFVYSAKTDFMQSAGSLLSKYASQANNLSDPKTKSNAYRIIAEGWRDLTKAATWGNHAFNKTYCDNESKKFYGLALREDRNNTDLQKTVEKINTPKKPVPAAVSATPAIPEAKWAEAENIRNLMAGNETDFVEKITREEKPNYLAVGVLSLHTGSGSVQIMHSGTTVWEDITSNSIDVYPGDKIKTGDDAVNVSFVYEADRSFLAIKPGATVTIFEEYLYIERGNVFVRVVKKGGDFLVITPTAVTGPRGTEFSVYTDAGKTHVNLYEGIIEMRNATNIAYITPGEKASVAGDDEILTEKFNIENDKRQNWNGIIENNLTRNSPGLNTGLFDHVTGGFTVK